MLRSDKKVVGVFVRFFRAPLHPLTHRQRCLLATGSCACRAAARESE
jgi:hypothetical protein